MHKDIPVIEGLPVGRDVVGDFEGTNVGLDVRYFAQQKMTLFEIIQHIFGNTFTDKIN